MIAISITMQFISINSANSHSFITRKVYLVMEMTSHTFEALEPKYQNDGEEENVPENAITEKVEKLDTEVGGDGD